MKLGDSVRILVRRHTGHIGKIMVILPEDENHETVYIVSTPLGRGVFVAGEIEVVT